MKWLKNEFALTVKCKGIGLIPNGSLQLAELGEKHSEGQGWTKPAAFSRRCLRKAQRLLWDPGMEQFPGMGIRKFLPTKPSTDIPPDRTKIQI